VPADPIAIIPAAGVGTRLRPHTYTQPKVLLHVAGKPMLGHILDDLIALGIRKVVLIAGYMGERVVGYVRGAYPSLATEVVDQPERLGLGHAVSLAEPHAPSGPILVVLGDTLFEADLGSVLAKGESSIGVKAVEDPRRFGIVETGPGGRVVRMVEKPEHPTSNLAITGVYYFADGAPLFAALRELQRKDRRTRGEFQLTDAMQLMIERGETITTFPIVGWYDCGKTETLLETNRILLEKRGGDTPAIAGSVTHGPVWVSANAVVEGCILGPHVSVAAGARLRHAVVRDSIINENARVEEVLLEGSVVGENAVVGGGFRRINVGDSSEVSII
jgi:glucose-1-phosphate thymidylyltransferase